MIKFAKLQKLFLNIGINMYVFCFFLNDWAHPVFAVKKKLIFAKNIQ